MPVPQDTPTWTHDREHVRLLHHAHADHIQAQYLAMQAVPGNLAGVVIQQFGHVRTFIASGDRLENRAIFSSQETDEQVDAVLDHFHRHRCNCVIEVNPANYYVDPPNNREQRLLKQLLHRGCRIDGFRCVWSRTSPPGSDEPPPRHRWQRFGPADIDQLERVSILLDPQKHWTAIERAMAAAAGLLHYVCFDGDRPVAISSLFIGGRFAYLQWSWTHPDFRGRGCQQEAIRLRVRDAFAAGCQCAFTVTDFNFASPRNLQRRGFGLAYNYLLVRRDAPAPAWLGTRPATSSSTRLYPDTASPSAR